MPEITLAYLGIAVMVVLAPGPDLAVVLKNGFHHGGMDRRVATWTSLGVVSSLLVHGTAVALGVAGIILGSEVAFNAIKYAGTAYMVFLGVQALRAALDKGAAFFERDASSGVSEAGARRSVHGYRQGFVSNITNPKVLAFYFSLLPQFVDPARNPAPQVLVLAGIHAGFALGWLLFVVFALRWLEPLMTGATGRRVVEGVLGVYLIGFGVRLALSSPN